MGVKKTLKSSSGKIFLGNCLGMVVLFVLLVTLALFGLDHYTLHGEEIAVPETRGMDERTAVAKFEDLGLRAQVVDTGFNRAMPDKVVLEQSIEPGTHVKANRLIRLTINTTGAPTITIPDIANNSSLREAETRLRTLGFRLTSHEVIPGDADWVYAIKVRGRTLNSGERLSTDTPLTLVVGDGLVEEVFNGADSTYDFGMEETDASSAVDYVGTEEELDLTQPLEENTEF